ncbi:MAG TPA: hypothetical protein VLT89_10460 [Usitatibacter sp.]|nr:hypothetical protein [Usitatibacter sp.]
MSARLHEQDQFECFGVTAPMEAHTEVARVPPLPGTNRRSWVYREMAMLGPDAAPWVDPQDFS